ncbi:YjzC family protein [Thermanaeromonas toyohensis]|uniref:YjzC family protein n=1 Tax=Thermanaeromonas toyohensis TaxID=161154 RepID=UPI0009FD53C8|nr:YjzC family protein [Thermanaeromonas toyohensis]
MSKKQNLFKPGEKAPESGQYEIVGPRGGKTPYGERTVVEGEPFPPTPEPGLKYKEVDPTKHGKK